MWWAESPGPAAAARHFGVLMTGAVVNLVVMLAGALANPVQRVIAGLGLTLAGVLTTVLMCVAYFRARQFAFYASATTGTVVGHEEEVKQPGVMYRPLVEFVPGDQPPLVVPVPTVWLIKPPEVGRQVPLLYDPRRPHKVMAGGTVKGELRLLVVVLAFFGGGPLLTGVAFLAWPGSWQELSYLM